MGVFAEQLKNSAADMDGMAAWLDSLDHDTRVKEVRSLGPTAQKRLWVLAESSRMTVNDMVPESSPALRPVRHYGRNTLPVFKMFEKRFCRAPEGAEPAGLWGYNEGSTRGVVGPGYFVCRATTGAETEIADVVIDYTLLPTDKPESWPTIQPNEKGVSRFVYAGMQDFMRKVSAHVTIGRAYRYGKVSNNYFMLCREA